MVEAVRDRSLDWLCSASSSSSAFERVLEGSANCSNVKGWDELVNLYSAGVHAGDKAGSENGSQKRRNSEKSEETNEKNGLTASQPTASFFKGNQITCPVCEYVISSNALRAGDIISRKFLRHLRKHEGELDNTMKIPCTSCYHFCKKSRMDDHFKQHHGEAAEDTGVRNVICFTNSTRRYQSMVDTISA
ncbi:unnamed protein product [Heligmosomoides polygyrus]|uniref:C2H2-type domain-containing protein n=1 Tax=Heligmosomoides polygyrus TaxID=6339 RepID=A0A183FUD5_HELPZ|nr:unnamed protein product [Heligmosomoides polygyrus]